MGVGLYLLSLQLNPTERGGVTHRRGKSLGNFFNTITKSETDSSHTHHPLCSTSPYHSSDPMDTKVASVPISFAATMKHFFTKSPIGSTSSAVKPSFFRLAKPPGYSTENDNYVLGAAGRAAVASIHKTPMNGSTDMPSASATCQNYHACQQKELRIF